MGNSFDSQYVLEGKLGRGSYGCVYKCRHRTTKKNFAVKVIDRISLDNHSNFKIRREIDIMKRIHHKNIVQFHECFVEPNRYLIVMELVEGGELFDLIASHSSFTELKIQRSMISMFSAIQYLHAMNIAHRDLKPENILTTGVDTSLKLADFGFAAYCASERDLEVGDGVGSEGYMAPEILQGRNHGFASDIWSLGVVCYILVEGRFPFRSRYHNQNKLDAVRGRIPFDSALWDNLSPDLRLLVEGMLTADPQRRLTANQIMAHPWMRAPSRLLTQSPLCPRQLRMFLARRKFRVWAQAIQTCWWMSSSRFLTKKSRSISNISPLDPPTHSSTLTNPPLPQKASFFNYFVFSILILLLSLSLISSADWT